VAPAPDHVLIVDDDRLLRNRLAAYLGREGFRVTPAEGGAAARRVLARERVDLAIVDLVMPGEDGLSLTRFLRERSAAGIIILTGRGEPVDRVVGLEVGADDYVAKPFDARELLARVRSVLRRTKGAAPRGAAAEPRPAAVRFAGWRLDPARRALTSPRGEPVHLTDAEFRLLSALAADPGRVLSRDRLLDLAAARGWEPYDRSVDLHVSHLRRKLGDDARRPALIRTVRGQGYALAAPVERG
jgi:two-component system OmpR family response regulator